MNTPKLKRISIQLYSLLLLALCICVSSRAANVGVLASGFSFSPPTVTINAGDTVTWTSTGSHDVQNDAGSAVPFQSPPPGTWTTFSFTFTTAGNYPYHCNPHAALGMRGTVIVKAAANQAPTVSLTSPANGATFSTTDTITFSADASDPDGTVAKVEFFDGATSLGSDTASPYSIALSLPAGSHTITAKATDNGGTTSTSTAATITVNPPANQPPTVTLTAPGQGATFNTGQTITLSADANDPDGTVSKVDFLDGATVIGTDTSAPYSVDVTLAAGSHTISARATDNAGAVTGSSSVTITVNAVANNAPTVSITKPTPNTTVESPASITLEANASDSDGQVVKVEYFDAANPLGSAVTAPYTVTPSFLLKAGAHTLTAVATDDKGATTTSAAITLIVAPRLSIAKVSSTEFKLTANGLSSPATIQSTTALPSGWTDLATVNPSRTGAISFNDVVSSATAFKFYRILVK